MAEYLSKVSIETPVKNMRDFDLSCQHVTTQTFMRPSVAYAKEFFGSPSGTKIKLNLKTYSRLAPMLKPALGSVQIRNRAFFCAYRQCWPVFDEFLEQVPIPVSGGGSQIINAAPYFTLKDLTDIFTTPSYGYVSVVTTSPVDIQDLRSDAVSYVLTPAGRQAAKILEALGYLLPRTIHTSTPMNQSFAFLPLLAVCKTFIDWYFPAQYAHTGEFIAVDGICSRYFSYTASSTDLYNCLQVLQYVFYDNDYFTSQWDNPVSPSAGLVGFYNIADVTNDSPSSIQHVVNDRSLVTSPSANSVLPSNFTPFVGSVETSGVTSAARNAQGVFTQFVDTALKKVTNAVKRHQLVGARVIDRMLADFGLVTSYQQTKRSYYLGSQVFPVQISDVMSNSDTFQSGSGGVSGAVLGDYSGKGVAFDGNGNFEFETKEFGLFFVLNSIVPDVSYSRNVDRQCLHLTRLDFFNPNFDALGVMAVSQAEVNGYANGSTSNPFTNVFGFVPMYADYKMSFDRLTGDYTFGSRDGGLDSWLTYRNLGVFVSQHGVLGAHSLEFMRGSDAFQFCRLFYGYQGDEFDCFYIVHRINLKVTMAASPMYDTYQFDEEEGEKIMMQSNGARLN